jgi:predicted small lipoprotein YifL
MRLLALLMLSVTLTACGVKRPLVAPRDIPNYEARQMQNQRERQDFLQQQRQMQAPIRSNSQSPAAPSL